jgi:hypothetical protein
MITILTGDEKRRSEPTHNEHDQHIHLAINNDYHYDDYAEVLYDYHHRN